ncbi:hypothetical protein GCM10027168_70300 [Streptomyces capparidis]
MCAVALAAVLLPAAGAAADPGHRVDLRILVVDDGSGTVAAIVAELESTGIPYTTVSTADPDRPVIDEGFLSDTVDGTPRAKYQGVVLPNENPFGAGSAELAAIASYERRFGIRQVDAYSYANPDVGLNHPLAPGYSGPLDGTAARVTEAGRGGWFRHLEAVVPFEDLAPDVPESYGFLATPLPPGDGARFTTYLDAPIPGSSERGVLVGEYAHDGRRELVLTFAYNAHQGQFRLLARGIVAWLTEGAHLGFVRNYFAVHVDDVFASDARWDTERNCTTGAADCPGDGGAPRPAPIRMTADDAWAAAEWSRRHGLTLDLAYNGGGSEDHKEDNGGTDPLAERIARDQSRFRFVNHTWSHTFLGCVQDVTVVPWTCAKDEDGQVRWTGREQIRAEITRNRDWGTALGLHQADDELITGEHSGLAHPPQQPLDNPEFTAALADTGIGWVAGDNSRESQQRGVGPARTVPRHPMNVFFNVARVGELVDEYNWIHTRRADGGSGLCETAAHTTCLDAPLDPATGFASHIVPLEARIALGHITSNDLRPHFVHQSNLAEERVAYPVLERILRDHDLRFADDVPLVNLRMRDIGAELGRRAAWRDALRDGRVTAYRVGGTVTVTVPDGVQVPATMPLGTGQHTADGDAAFGTPYAGAASGWAPPPADGRVTLVLPTAPA